MRWRRHVKAAVLGLAGLVSAPGELSSDPASPYLYLDHWAYHYIDLLQDRGYLGELDRSVRPYPRGDVARSIRLLSKKGGVFLTPVESRWLDLLMEEFAGDIQLIDGAKGKGPSHYMRGLAREEGEFIGDDRDADYYLSGEVLFRSPSILYSGRFSLDQSLFDDPFYRGRKDISIAGRVEDSYLLARFSWATLFFGRVDRVWSPFPDQSLFLSQNPFSYDHLFLRIGGERLSLQSLFARLSDLPSGAPDSLGAQRYLAAHRLGFRLGDWLQMGIFESAVFGGPGEGIDFALLNPFSPYMVIENSTKRQMNSFVGFDLYVRPAEKVTASMQLLIDDVKLSLFGEPIFHGEEVEPNEFGFSVGGTYSDPFGLPNSLLRGRYMKVTNYTYNARDSLERYLHEGMNLGTTSGNDFDEASLDVALFPWSDWTFSARTIYRRQGEGRVTDPFPETFETDEFPFPSGVVERRISLNMELRYQRSAAWYLRGGFGIEGIRNRGNVLWDDDTRVRGNLALEVSWYRWLI